MFLKRMRILKFMALAVVVCCGIGMFFSCGKGNTVTSVESTELLRTSQSWNGMELPDYPQGRPELVAVKYVIPPGQKLGWHHHVSMNHGVIVQGELKIIGQDGKTTVLHAGDVVVEMVDAVHHGESCGTEPVVLYMFYLSQKDLPLSVQHPDIPLE